MTASENRADVPGADTAEKPRASEESASAQPSDSQSKSQPTVRQYPTRANALRQKRRERSLPALPQEDPAELRERLLRVLAEQQNFRRRLERERDDAVRFAATQLIKDLLQTADNLSRALQSVTPGLPDTERAATEPAGRGRRQRTSSARHFREARDQTHRTRPRRAVRPQPTPGDVRSGGERVRARDHRPDRSARLCLPRTATPSGFRRGCQTKLRTTGLRQPNQTRS